MVKKHPFTSYPAEMHPKRSKFAITDMRQKPVDFFCCTTRASAAKVSVTVYNSLVNLIFLYSTIFQRYFSLIPSWQHPPSLLISPEGIKTEFIHFSEIIY